MESLWSSELDVRRTGQCLADQPHGSGKFAIGVFEAIPP